MYTANTMASAIEALGMSLPYHESQLGNRLLALLATEWSPEQAPGLDTLRYFNGSVLDDKQQVDVSKLQVVWQS